MKRFVLPVVPLHRLPKSLANRAVVVGLTLMVMVAFLEVSFAAAPLLPKRTVPQRIQTQTVSGKDSLIQLVVFDEENFEIMVPPAPPLRKPWEAEFPSHESFSDDDYDEDFEEEGEAEEEYDPLADFPLLDASRYEFPPITELPVTQSVADSVPQIFSSPPLTFVNNSSAPAISGLPQYPQLATLGQVSNQAVNPYPQAPYAYNPYASNPYAYQQQGGTAYVNPYGYGPYGYPNAPGAYWGPTGFTPNPYAAYAQMSYQGYPGYSGYPGYPPYGYRPETDEEQSDSLTSTAWETLGYFNPFKSPKGPNRGVGGPLMMRSWRDRPFYLGAFGGIMSGGELVSGLIEQGNGGTGGIVFGWYADNYWGLESRLHFAGLPGKNTGQGQDAYEQWYQANGGATFVPPTSSRNNAIAMLDVSVHYYPLGNAKWRPYLKLGLGTANQQFRDMYGEKRNYNSFMIPWGIGLKYWWNERIALQMELADNVLFAVEEAKTQNNVALTVGLNFPLGKIKRKDPVIYWPMIPSSGR